MKREQVQKLTEAADRLEKAAEDLLSAGCEVHELLNYCESDERIESLANELQTDGDAYYTVQNDVDSLRELQDEIEEEERSRKSKEQEIGRWFG